MGQPEGVLEASSGTGTGLGSICNDSEGMLGTGGMGAQEGVEGVVSSSEGAANCSHVPGTCNSSPSSWADAPK